MPEAAVPRDDAVRHQPGGVRPALLRRQPAPHRRPLHPQGVDARPGHLQVRTNNPLRRGCVISPGGGTLTTSCREICSSGMRLRDPTFWLLLAEGAKLRDLAPTFFSCLLRQGWSKQQTLVSRSQSLASFCR